jgi:uncharacterized protein (DUF952 family)
VFLRVSIPAKMPVRAGEPTPPSFRDTAERSSGNGCLSVRLFHITTKKAWESAVGEYRPASLETEGFIHLSTEPQWPRTLERFFKGQSGLVLLELEVSKLRAPLKHEPADGDVFPHLYGPLNLDAVVAVHPVAPSSAGAATATGRGSGE